jgi:hypothetical protein
MSRIAFNEAPTSNSLAITGRRPRSTSFSGYNMREVPTPRILWLQPEGGYNALCSPTIIGRWIQPPILSLSNCPEIKVE